MAGGWCCAVGKSVHHADPQGKALTWELAASNWALQTELQLEDMMCWSLCSAVGPPRTGIEARSCLPAILGTLQTPKREKKKKPVWDAGCH